MSLKTWKQEFYSSPRKCKTALEAAEHSLKKWIGFNAENLTKHGLRFAHAGSLESVAKNRYIKFGATSETCALCVMFLHTCDSCDACPLVKSGSKECGKHNSPYWRSCNTLDPKYIIEALEKAVKYCKKHPDEI